LRGHCSLRRDKRGKEHNDSKSKAASGNQPHRFSPRK